ncbi:winged helix-turn-helix transcriptional regulator [Paenibacillus alkalitolerans]|uniref:winged helix-turn-helix transcriptional regulator n=1 Tax=Paenibacillus alkalitolerans TaxID=2799335 RepID=UPI0018F67775|nr:helix-turn-helix domain-containing protein [Paenibacillus alkalitolerans]
MTKSKKLKPDLSIEECAYRRVLEIISNKWTVLVITALANGSMRYGEVRRRIFGISQKMLTQTLRHLEREGLVKRDVHPSVPPTVDYTLTPLGETLVPLLHQMKEWADGYYPLVEQARRDYDREDESAN